MQEILRGAAEVLPSREALRERLALGRPLRIKLGVDPTNFDLHLGHTVPLRKLLTFQRLGHEVQFLIGGFTARIGDPTGRSEARPQLTRDQVETYAAKFLEQVFTILDRSRTTVMNNADWFERMTFADAIAIAAQATVARMLERDYFEARWEKQLPIHLHEFLYPTYAGPRFCRDALRQSRSRHGPEVQHPHGPPDAGTPGSRPRW
jgi:tyrosyl-tRNA synthetase